MIVPAPVWGPTTIGPMPGVRRERTALQRVQRLRERRIGSGTRWDRTEARRTRAVLGPQSR